jgi:hypothetical protein
MTCIETYYETWCETCCKCDKNVTSNKEKCVFMVASLVCIRNKDNNFLVKRDGSAIDNRQL